MTLTTVWLEFCRGHWAGGKIRHLIPSKPVKKGVRIDPGQPPRMEPMTAKGIIPPSEAGWGEKSTIPWERVSEATKGPTKQNLKQVRGET